MKSQRNVPDVFIYIYKYTISLHLWQGSTKKGPMHTPVTSHHSGATGESPRGGGLLFLSAVVAALGSLLFGFDTAVISGTTEALRHAFALNDN